MFGISAHMILKNEDQWVWYSLQSILPYADEVLVTDTGSTDKTLDIIKSIASPKIKFTQVATSSPIDVTRVREDQLKETKTPWVWIVDGDEIYPKTTAEECVQATRDNRYEGVVVHRYDLLGDIYHRQVESVGRYELFGQKGHLLVRMINKDRLTGLEYRGDYPNEGFFDDTGASILTRDPADWYVTQNYLYHAMYLKRSSLGGNLPMFNRSKYKVEKGIKLEGKIPEIFTMSHSPLVPDPTTHRSLGYEILASVVTPIKKLKRRIT